MDTSTYQSLKLAILDLLNLSKDAIHIHIGMAVFLTAILLWKHGKISVAYLIPVFVIAGGMEVLDLLDDWQSLGYLRWSASLHDVINTTLWPTIIVFLIKYFDSKKPPLKR